MGTLVGPLAIALVVYLVTRGPAARRVNPVAAATGREALAAAAAAMGGILLVALLLALLAGGQPAEPAIATDETGDGAAGGSFDGVFTALALSGAENGVSLGMNHAWLFLHFAVVGASEEFVFRGFLQQRLEAWAGLVPGWLIASAAMALAHVGQRMTVQAMSPTEALVDSAMLMPASLLMGWIMIRTRNLAAPAIVHLFMNWAYTLG